MDNIRNVIKILFRHTSAEEVLAEDVWYKDVRWDSFLQLSNVYMAQYSDNEVENMFKFLSSEFEWHNNKMRNRINGAVERRVNVFDALLLFADNVLVEESNEPFCRYENLLRWRAMTIEVEEDIFITAFLAQRDLMREGKYRTFFWPPVIGHDNKALNRLMAQGVAENHFHLKGSAPLFHLSWCSLMNDVINSNFRRSLEDYDKMRLERSVPYQSVYGETSLYMAWLQAALIRMYLFLRLMDEPIILQDDYVPYRRIKAFLCVEETERGQHPADEELVSLGDYCGKFRDISRYKQLKWECFGMEVKQLLREPYEILYCLGEIQDMIEYIKETYAPGQLDYTLHSRYITENPMMHLNEVISGERWLMYKCFQWIYSENYNFDMEINWFYAYLLIKERIRAEMVQVNHNVGFHNFQRYQDRKESFIDGTPFEAIYLRMAVRDTILNQNIRKLEARITPKNSVQKLREVIKRNDNAILEIDGAELKKQYFYVCHFIKEKDPELERIEHDVEEKEDFFRNTFCRHYKKRAEIKQQAQAIYEFRKQQDDLAERIRGIDASAEEIVCRPEVFAQAFRFLKNESISHKDYLTGVTKRIPDLCITYHVGEDFLDITDGLRAIDEAMSFLNMRCGDRLGHALALGVNVDEWYASKSGYILIPQMDYLDNLVWLYSKIRKLCLEGYEGTLRYIEKRYDEYFHTIYLNNMRDGDMQDTIQAAMEYYDRRGMSNIYQKRQYQFSINTYYDSWKLRGDAPEYFKGGFFRLDETRGSLWNEYGINKIFPENYRIRYSPEAAYLYYSYQYNPQVKREGNKRREIKVNTCIIEAVKAVQKEMQWIIARRGIAIETNPSSNALIGTFKRYDKHPILNWYNNGLVNASEKFEVPQIQVSINTDDQGVFATYIENEYAYLALSLEKSKGVNGNQKYSRTMIYEWIDNVRKMGLVQCFEEI